MAERVVIRRHAIHRGDCTQGAGVIIGAAIAHHAHSAHRQDRHKGLPNLIIKTVFADLVDVDGIRLAQDVQLVAGNLAGATDRQTRSGGPGVNIRCASLEKQKGFHVPIKKPRRSAPGLVRGEDLRSFPLDCARRL